jgi:hypothetical protein
VNLHGVLLHVKRHIGHVEEVVGKILFDEITAISGADDKVTDSVNGINLHHMPEDWLAPNFHHGLGPSLRFLGDATANAPGKNYSLHGVM